MYTLLVTGDVPGAATYFNPLLQQTIVPCTSGTRPSSPPNGMHVYETDTTRLMKWNSGLSAWEAVAGSRQSFTPTLTASGTSPTIGTGAVRSGWYTYLPGGSVQYTFFIRAGTSYSGGTGNYAINLPVASALPFGSTVHSSVGPLLMADSSASVFRVGSCFVDSSTGTLGLVAESSTIVTNSAPWVWAVGDYISGSIIYPV
jgi:hypothetical protein